MFEHRLTEISGETYYSRKIIIHKQNTQIHGREGVVLLKLKYQNEKKTEDFRFLLLGNFSD